MPEKIILSNTGNDEVSLSYSSKPIALDALLNWKLRGFNAVYDGGGCLKIIDYRHSGYLRKVFDIFEINRLEKKEAGLKVEVSWQYIKLEKIARDAARILRKAGFNNVAIRINNSRSNGSYHYPVKWGRVIEVNNGAVIEIERQRWIFQYKKWSSRKKKDREAQAILIPFLESLGIKEWNWRQDL